MPRPYCASPIFHRLVEAAAYNFRRRIFMNAIAERHRKSIRLKNYDYSQMGAYFVTICTHNRACLFGNISDDAMNLNKLGEIANSNWQAIPNHFAHVSLDAFVVMPNHVHGILLFYFDNNSQKTVDSVLGITERSGAKSGSLGAVVASYKSSVSKQINMILGQSAQSVWQRNYYERVIRNERELLAVRKYIEDNPLQWQLDADNLDMLL